MIRKHQPYPIEKMSNIIAPQYTICETLRQLWRCLDKLNLDDKNKTVSKAKLCVREAVTMAKAMDEKLRNYEKAYAKSFFEKNIKDNKMRKVYIDCGAWEGDSIMLFKKYFEDHEIYGFECEPRLRKDLEQLSIKQDFSLIYKAVYIQDCSIRLYPGIENFTESSSVLSSKTTYIDNKKYINVEAIDFSQWILDNFEVTDLIICKMNIEGAEYDVLEKMIEDGSIYYIDYLLVEWHNDKIKGFNQDRHNDLKDKLRGIVALHDWTFAKKYKSNPFKLRVSEVS